MAISYVLTEDVHTVNRKRYIFYGIEAWEDGRPLLSFRDVSTDREGMEALVDDCNRLSLSPIHLCEVVEDFIG